jgi:phosphonate C-P lyase system protein PhnH
MLKALSHPGRRYIAPALSDEGTETPLLYQVAACLLDHEVTFALSDQCEDALHQVLTQHTGALSTEWNRADFLFIAGGESNGKLADAKRGSLAYPDHGATAIYFLPVTAEGSATDADRQCIRLSGPGIENPMAPGLAGLTKEEYCLLRNINADYPKGVDVFVIEDNHYIMGLPRSTRIEVE